jgi:hypothetical protein
MNKIPKTRAELAICTGLVLLFLHVSCKTTAETMTAIPSQIRTDYPQAIVSEDMVPYVPPQYYACIEVTLDDLLKNYFSHYGNLDQAEQTYNGLPFVFNSVAIFSPSMLVNSDTLQWGNAMFTAMVPGAVSRLRVGEFIDVVGILQGPMPDCQGTPIASWFNPDGSPLIPIVPGWLYFTDCIFLPTGSVRLPAPGGPVFAPLY